LIFFENIKIILVYSFYELICLKNRRLIKKARKMMSDIFPIKEAAPKLKIALVTLRRLIKKRAIPYHKIGAKYFLTNEDIQLFLSNSSTPMEDKKNENPR
jgi:excisionase family DNA binding protein